MILNQITSEYYYNRLSEIITNFKGEARLSELKSYMMKHSYFKEFGYEPAWLAYQIYIESL
jgi:hypothetical protein